MALETLHIRLYTGCSLPQFDTSEQWQYAIRLLPTIPGPLQRIIIGLRVVGYDRGRAFNKIDIDNVPWERLDKALTDNDNLRESLVSFQLEDGGGLNPLKTEKVEIKPLDGHSGWMQMLTRVLPQTFRRQRIQCSVQGLQSSNEDVSVTQFRLTSVILGCSLGISDAGLYDQRAVW